MLQEETKVLTDPRFTGISEHTDFQKSNVHHAETGDSSRLRRFNTFWEEKKVFALTFPTVQGDTDALTFNPPCPSFGGCMLIPN